MPTRMNEFKIKNFDFTLCSDGFTFAVSLPVFLWIKKRGTFGLGKIIKTLFMCSVKLLPRKLLVILSSYPRMCFQESMVPENCLKML